MFLFITLFSLIIWCSPTNNNAAALLLIEPIMAQEQQEPLMVMCLKPGDHISFAGIVQQNTIHGKVTSLTTDKHRGSVEVVLDYGEKHSPSFSTNARITKLEVSQDGSLIYHEGKPVLEGLAEMYKEIVMIGGIILFQIHHLIALSLVNKTLITQNINTHSLINNAQHNRKR